MKHLNGIETAPPKTLKPPPIPLLNKLNNGVVNSNIINYNENLTTSSPTTPTTTPPTNHFNSSIMSEMSNMNSIMMVTKNEIKRPGKKKRRYNGNGDTNDGTNGGGIRSRGGGVASGSGFNGNKNTKLDALNSTYRWQHSFSNSLLPPTIPKKRQLPQSIDGSPTLSPIKFCCKPKVRSPFVKKMPWSSNNKTDDILENIESKIQKIDSSQVLQLEKLTVNSKSSLTNDPPFQARPVGALGGKRDWLIIGEEKDTFEDTNDMKDNNESKESPLFHRKTSYAVSNEPNFFESVSWS